MVNGIKRINSQTFVKLLTVSLIILIFFVTYTSVKSMKLLALILLSLNLYSHKGNDTIRKPELKNTGGLCDNVIGVCKKPFYTSSDYVFDSQIYQHRCDTLAQVKFWRKIMNL